MVKFGDLAIGQKFKFTLVDKAETYVKKDELEIRTLSGDTIWANAICLEDGAFVMFPEDSEVNTDG